MKSAVVCGSKRYKDEIAKFCTGLEHFDWIRKAEVCYVYNKADYVGASVTMEMA